jgi:phosphate:Na+ symporter
MSIFNLLSLFGGLAMFLYGMNIMGKGLEKLGGGKFERILAKLTSSPIKGVMLGIGVTAVIQSSSATTVMVVGFVNSGIMKLSQAIGVIMGANIGTTVTSWILSLSGIEGESFLIQRLKPVNFTPILAVIGIILNMSAKTDKKKIIGDILLGFSILMFGMNLMSSSVEPLADVPEFANILTMFQNPILGVLAGAILTAIIQSSSASVGILQALSATGAISFGAAIPIIMGQNIGTCATALISCIGASKNAKRAAMVHLYFNIIGTILFLSLFYIANAIFHFEFVNTSVNEVSIAIVHSIFNITATAVLLPFNKLLEKLAKLTIKEGGSTDAFSVLDDRFLLTPPFAIQQCMTLATNLAYIAKETFEQAIYCIENYSDSTDAHILENEQITDDYEDALENYLIKLSSRHLDINDSQKVSMILHSVGDFEQIADYAVNILYVAREKHKKGFQFSEKAKSELVIMAKAVNEMFDNTIRVFSDNDLNNAMKSEPLGDVISSLRKNLKNRHVNRMQNGKCTVGLGFIFTDYISALDKVADHCQSVTDSVILMNDPSYDVHSPSHKKRREEDAYKNLYTKYTQKFALPFSKSTIAQ